MIYLLDSNVCAIYLNQRSTPIEQRLRTIAPEDIALCSVVKAELYYGAMKSTRPDVTLARQQTFLNQFISLPFEDKAAEVYGRIRARLASLGTPIGPNDLMIASIALANNLILVTHNTREFSRVAGLQLEDWEATP